MALVKPREAYMCVTRFNLTGWKKNLGFNISIVGESRKNEPLPCSWLLFNDATSPMMGCRFDTEESSCGGCLLQRLELQLAKYVNCDEQSQAAGDGEFFISKVPFQEGGFTSSIN